MRNKIKSICKVLLILSAFVVFSCSGYLIEEPRDFRSSTNSYNDATSIKAGLLGIYGAYYQLYINKVTPFVGELGTDEVVAGFNQNDITPLYLYSFTAQDLTVLPNWYKYHYDVINRANVLIDRTSELAKSSDEIRTMVAEAKTLRAWAYFRLAQTFGPVPLVIKETTAPVDYSIPRSPLNDIYTQILKDLNEAVDPVILPLTKSASSPVRITQWVAKAMLGKVYLTMASAKEAGKVDALMTKLGKNDYGYNAIQKSTQELYELAREELKDIVENSNIQLEPDYRKLFVVENKNKFNENMWELQANDGVSTSNTGQGFYFLFRYGAPQGGNSTPVVNGLFRCDVKFGGAMLIRSAGGFQEDDQRKSWVLNGGYKSLVVGVSVPQYIFQNYNVTTKKYGFMNWTLERQESDWKLGGAVFYSGVTKYRFNIADSLHVATTYRDNTSLPMNFTVIRYADVLLMYAEACYKANGDVATQAVIDCMNFIRDRARGTVTPSATLPKYTDQITIDDILNERKLELCFESVRWFDLARTGKLFEKYNELPLSGTSSHPVITDEKYYLYPIPQAQIDGSLNKEGFFQNYGF